MALMTAGVSRAAAQGVTTGAISGVVTDASGAPVEAAQVQVTNRSTGATVGGVTRQNGFYTIVGLEVGGPYSVMVRRIGFTPDQRDNLRVTLGQTTRADFSLTAQAAQLSTVRVTGMRANAVISPTKTGISTTVSDSSLRRLPSLNRNFTDFVTLVPQVASTYNGTSDPNGLSGGGVNNRYNNIQIDGASQNDLFGLGATGQPGGQANGKSISVESVKEYQVLLSPFDLRQGNFAGAQINAVTKNGTNQLHGSAYIYGYNEKFARNVPQIRSAPYTQKQYGFSLGGPIIKNHILFFVNPEWQRRSSPASGPYLGEPSGAPVPVYISPDSITAFNNTLKNQYGINGGSAGLITNTNPLLNVFARLDFVNLPFNSRFVIRENYAQADLGTFGRSSSVNGTYALSSNAFLFHSLTHGTVAQLFSNFSNGISNELLFGTTRIRDRRVPASSAPQIDVRTASTAGGFATLRAGAERFSQGNQLDQDVLELTDNLTIPAGDHQFVLGTKNEFFKFRNLFAQASYGVWSFSSLANLQAGTPNSYTIGAVLPGANPNAVFHAATYSLYAEDIWTVTPRFTLTYGLRTDIPTIRDKPPTNQLLLQQTGFDTHQIPSGNIQWSPRAGFNWDVTGDQRNQLRGGAGIFVGRPAYVWVGNVFANNGVTGGVANLSCFGSNPAPAFNTAAIAAPPTACANGLTAASGGEIDLLSKHLRLPSDARFSLGFDHRFDNGTTLSLEGLYTKGLDNFFYQNAALAGVQGYDRFGRALFGTINTAGFTQPTYIGTGQRTQIYRVVNASKDYAYDMTATLQRQFTNRFEGSLAYTYGHSYTAQDQTSSRAVSNFLYGRATSGNEFVPVAGRSVFDIPHRVVAQASYAFPTKTDLSFIYTGQSGNAYDYTYGGSGGRGDLNADGTNSNDLVFVPTDVNDPNQIQWATTSRVSSSATAAAKLADIQAQKDAFAKYIASEPCLANSRGRILKRNDCRAPWVNTLNVSVRQSLAIPQLHGHDLSVQLDVFNFLNLLNSNWGQVRVPTFQGSQSLLSVVGSCAAGAYNSLTGSCATPATADAMGGGGGAVPVVTFNPGLRKYVTLPLASNYQMQLSARYTF